MILDLLRDDIRPDVTLGVLRVNGFHVCETAENVDRKLEGGVCKTDPRTAIPRGTYKIRLDPSERFSQLSSSKIGKPVRVIMPVLLDVPQYEDVRIHWGNTEIETAGDIVVGRRSPVGVYNSRIEYERLLQIYLFPAHHRQEDIWITVR